MASINLSPSEVVAVGHTPGPWGVAKNGEVVALSRPSPAGNHFGCVAWHGYAGCFRIAEADAYLMAAAPDLLWSLKQLIQALPVNRDWLDPSIERLAKQTIEAAEGR